MSEDEDEHIDAHMPVNEVGTTDVRGDAADDMKQDVAECHRCGKKSHDSRCSVLCRSDVAGRQSPNHDEVGRSNENKDDDGKTCEVRPGARGFKPKREGPKDDLFVAMPPPEAKKALFALVAWLFERGGSEDLRC